MVSVKVLVLAAEVKVVTTAKLTVVERLILKIVSLLEASVQVRVTWVGPGAVAVNPAGIVGIAADIVKILEYTDVPKALLADKR